MNIKIVCIGKLKEKYWSEAIKEYSKRLKGYCDLNIIELKETPLRKDNKSEEQRVKELEGLDILKQIKEREYVIVLDVLGKELSSEAFAQKIDELGILGKSYLTLVIGGSYGLSEEVKKRGDFLLSFSRMTYPHQMMRVILLEQIYRASKINSGETYHK